MQEGILHCSGEDLWRGLDNATTKKTDAAGVAMNANLDQLEAATLSLTRPGPIKDRITEAFRNHLTLVDEAALSQELCAEFRAVTHYLTREKPSIRGEDAVRATVRKLSIDEAAQVATAIVQLFAAASRDAIHRAASASRPAGAKPSKKANVLGFYAGEA